MFEQVPIQTLVDAGFFATIAVGLARCLVRPSVEAAPDKQQSMTSELKSVENTLRQLVGEAASASSALDRNLLKRKRELETLLSKIENEERSSHQSVSNPNPQRPHNSQGELNDVPNSSWLSAESKPAAEVTPEQDALESVAASQADSVTLSSRVEHISKSKAQTGSARPSVERLLAKKQKRNRGQRKTAQLRLPNELSSQSDPAVYRIAERLLASGKEIHVVARKLELPLAEVRLIDRLLRHNEPKSESEEFAREAVSRFKANGKKNSIAKSSDDEFELEIASEDFDQDIERELAML